MEVFIQMILVQIFDFENIILPSELEIIDRCFLSYNEKKKVLDVPKLLEVQPFQSIKNCLKQQKKIRKRQKIKKVRDQ